MAYSNKQSTTLCLSVPWRHILEKSVTVTLEVKAWLSFNIIKFHHLFLIKKILSYYIRVSDILSPWLEQDLRLFLFF